MKQFVYGLDLGVLYPVGSIDEQFRELAWNFGLEYESSVRRGFLGSQIRFRVTGEDEDLIDAFARIVTANYG